MLRRHKSQVATELPEKVESVQYCDMTDEQKQEAREQLDKLKDQELTQKQREQMQQ